MAYIAYTNDAEWFNALADLGTLGAIKPPMYILSESTSSLATGGRAALLGCELKEFEVFRIIYEEKGGIMKW